MRKILLVLLAVMFLGACNEITKVEKPKNRYEAQVDKVIEKLEFQTRGWFSLSGVHKVCVILIDINGKSIFIHNNGHLNIDQTTIPTTAKQKVKLIKLYKKHTRCRIVKDLIKYKLDRILDDSS